MLLNDFWVWFAFINVIFQLLFMLFLCMFCMEALRKNPNRIEKITPPCISCKSHNTEGFKTHVLSCAAVFVVNTDSVQRTLELQFCVIHLTLALLCFL